MPVVKQESYLSLDIPGARTAVCIPWEAEESELNGSGTENGT